jgi:hypothetical protein
MLVKIKEFFKGLYTDIKRLFLPSSIPELHVRPYE